MHRRARAVRAGGQKFSARGLDPRGVRVHTDHAKQAVFGQLMRQTPVTGAHDQTNAAVDARVMPDALGRRRGAVVAPGGGSLRRGPRAVVEERAALAVRRFPVTGHDRVDVHRLPAQVRQRRLMLCFGSRILDAPAPGLIAVVQTRRQRLGRLPPDHRRVGIGESQIRPDGDRPVALGGEHIQRHRVDHGGGLRGGRLRCAG